MKCIHIQRALIESEQRHRRLTDCITDVFFAFDNQLRYTFWNRASEQATGVSASEALGKSFDEVFPDSQGSAIHKAYLHALETGKAISLENHWDGKYFDITIYPSEDGLSVFARDVTYRVQARQALAEQSDELQKQVDLKSTDLAAIVDDLQDEVRRRILAEENLKRLNRVRRMISECNLTLVKSEDEYQMMQDMCRIILDIGGYRMVWVGYAMHDQGKSVLPVASVGFEDGYLENAEISWGYGPRGEGPTGSAIRTGLPAIGQDFLSDPGLAPWREGAVKRGFRSSVSLPLSYGGRVLGALNIYSERPNAFYTEKVSALMELADDMAFGIMSIRTRAALRESQRLLQLVVHNAPVIIWTVDNEGYFTLANGKLELLGMSSEEFTGRHMREIFGENSEILLHVELARIGRPIVTEVSLCDLLLESSYSLLKNDDGEVTGVMCVSTDITERRRVEREALEATEREQRRIGRDLHDSIQSGIAGIGFMLAALKQRVVAGEGEPEQYAEQFDHLSEIVKDLLEQTRGLARGLCPADLSREGLAKALELLASTTSSLFGIPCAFYGPDSLDFDNEAAAAQLYYICQEAVNNAVKHSRCEKIEIMLFQNPDGLLLIVRDDGIGIPNDRSSGGGMGLRTMNYRAKMIGAALEINSTPRGGTVMRCSMPNTH